MTIRQQPSAPMALTVQRVAWQKDAAPREGKLAGRYLWRHHTRQRSRRRLLFLRGGRGSPSLGQVRSSDLFLLRCAFRVAEYFPGVRSRLLSSSHCSHSCEQWQANKRLTPSRPRRFRSCLLWPSKVENPIRCEWLNVPRRLDLGEAA